MIWLAVAGFFCAATPAAMFVVNLRLYVPPRAAKPGELSRISVLIPARNEENSITAAVESVLASVGCELEVVVMDDSSTDSTAEKVLALAAKDARVRLERAPLLAPGWNGKQHACQALAGTARYEVLCFMDADVRLEPEALVRMARFLKDTGAGLVSGFPRQVTRTSMEWLLLPLIHFVLLGFLPLSRMRAGLDPALAAGCGQFLMVRRQAYFESGGHAGIKATMHDGLRLPRLLREHGFSTDLADLTELATCRMYRHAGEVWQGLAKNATEGLADARRIGPVTLFLACGQVLPFVLAAWIFVRGGATEWTIAWVVAGIFMAWLPRALGVIRFGQSVAGAAMHPLGIVMLLAIQWYALIRKLCGGAVSWKSRAYSD